MPLRWLSVLIVFALVLAACSTGGDNDDDVAEFDIAVCGNRSGFELDEDTSLENGECVWLDVEEQEVIPTSTPVPTSTSTPEPEPTGTQEPTATLEPTAVPPTPTSVPPTATPIPPTATPTQPPAELWSTTVTVDSRDADGELVDLPHPGKYQVSIVSGKYWTGTNSRTVVFVSADEHIEYCTEWNEPCPTDRERDYYVGAWGTNEHPPRTIHYDGDIRIVTVDNLNSYKNLNEGSVTVEVREVN